MSATALAVRFGLATLVLALTAPAWLAAAFGVVAAADTAALHSLESPGEAV